MGDPGPDGWNAVVGEDDEDEKVCYHLSEGRERTGPKPTDRRRECTRLRSWRDSGRLSARDASVEAQIGPTGVAPEARWQQGTLFLACLTEAVDWMAMAVSKSSRTECASGCWPETRVPLFQDSATAKGKAAAPTRTALLSELSPVPAQRLRLPSMTRSWTVRSYALIQQVTAVASFDGRARPRVPASD